MLAVKKILPEVVLDLFAIALVYFLPILTHLTAIPFYVMEPFRLMILFNLVVLNDKYNALFLAAFLPLFSFIMSGHPLFAKTLLVSIEMILNVFVFVFLSNKVKQLFLVILISIVVSKTIYYLLKFGLIALGVLSMDYVSTSLLIQSVVAVLTSLFFCQIKKTLK